VSGAGEEAVPSALNADAIGMRAADWVQRRNFWNWSEADQAELDAWLGEALSHRIAYWRFAAAFERTARLAALRSPTDEPAPKPQRRWFRAVSTGAAVLLLAAVLGVIGSLLLPELQEKTYATSVGERETISLADGSQIELNTDTVTRVRANAHRRTVSLVKGEAYFEIRHDAARPFVVLAGAQRLTDIGTKFLVRRDADGVAVSVMEGRVKLDAADHDSHAPPTFLAAGDTVLATANKVSLTRKPPRELFAELGWRRGLLVFQHTTLGEAANEFNRYNAEKLVVADTKASALQINGTFRATDVEAFTSAAQAVFGLRVENRGGEIVISR
jgi:transmembrane sensor